MIRLHRPPPSLQHEGTLPLINVVFLLLVFFMVAGALERPDAFPVAPPRADAGDATRPDGEAVLIGADGRLAFGTELFPSVEALGAAVASHADHADQQPLTVKADAGVDAATVVGVLYGLRAAGIRRVTLLTEGS